MASDDLTGIDWLSSVSKREREMIRRHADLVTLPAGSALIFEGDSPRWFYALMEGSLAVCVDGDEVRTLSDPQPVNEVEVMRNEASPATVVAATDVRLLVMGRREFLGMLDEVPGLARRLLLRHIPATPRTTPRRPSLVPLPAA